MSLTRAASFFDRYQYFRERFQTLSVEAGRRKEKRITEMTVLPDATGVTSVSFPTYTLRRQAEWNAQAAIEAFFGWTEHVFIHIAILLGKLRTGDEVASLAAADWRAKFKAALDFAEPQTKVHYDILLDLRAQARNYMAHGAFGKRGEAFRFHSGAGAAPVILTSGQRNRFSLTRQPAFDERSAIAHIESFLLHLWSGPRAPAQQYVFSGLPNILTYAVDGTYERVMRSEEEMTAFVEQLSSEFDRATNMDW